MELTLVTGPTSEPLTLEEVKDHLRVEDTVSDALIQAQIVAVREHLDGYSGILGRALMTQTWDIQIATFAKKIRIPLPPLQSVTSVKYWNNSDPSVETTVASTVYRVETAGGFVELIDGQSWPTDIEARALPITIQAVVGYGDFNAVPQPILQAMLLLIDHAYNRRDTAEGYQRAAGALLTPYEVSMV